MSDKLTIKKKNIILESVKDDNIKQLLLSATRCDTATIRKFCSFTEQDWLCYLACLEYEPLKNRDDVDKDSSLGFGRFWGTPEETRVLSEELFKEIKEDDFPLAKKINFDLYLSLRISDHGFVSHISYLQKIAGPSDDQTLDK